jgi:formylglycine-generating enzyme required for sulfatase activity
LGRYEVTARCFRWCVEVGGCSADDLIRPAAWSGAVPTGSLPPEDYWQDPFYDDLPAVHLTFRGARDVCATLGGQLPTGAQWEHAARGTQGLMYPWGAAPSDPENPSEAERTSGYLDVENLRWGYGRAEVVEFVGRYPAGAGIYGHLDLYGNASEWTRDGAEPYEGPFDLPLIDPVVPDTRGVHAVRDWQTGPAYEWVGVNDDGELSPDDPLHDPNHAIGARCLFTTEPMPFIPDME